MALSPSQDDRHQVLQQLAAAWGIASLAPLSSLTRPDPSQQSAGFQAPNDDFLAEELLKRRRIDAGHDKNSQGGIRRAFTGKKKGWESQEVFKALDAHVENGGSPGVAEALISKLMAAGGDLNVANTKRRTNLLTRRKSLESLERSRVLQKAIGNRQADMVAALVQYADRVTLDSALPVAIRSGDVAIVELLLRCGANASQTADGQDAFRQLCITGGQADLVGLILQSDGRPSSSWVSQSMVDAVRRGCLDTVLRLSRSTADGNYNNAQVLKEAIILCRVDIVLAILTGAKPPTGPGLDEAFGSLFANTKIGPNEKLALAHGLLCAGASGDVVSEALVQASSVGFYEMVDLLVSYGASVEYQDAMVLQAAISSGKTHLVQLLLTDNTTLSRANASQCVSQIPKEIVPEDRQNLLSMLLRKGAGGPPVHDALVDAVEAGDIESVNLLLTQHFPVGRLVLGHDLRNDTRGIVYDGRHETASVDHRGGLALQIAVKASNIPLVKLLLAGKPTLETLAEIFPQILPLSPVARYEVAQSFLATGLRGPCVSQVLQEAIEEEPPRRDEHLIGLLLSCNADVNFNAGAGILSAISHQDTNLLETLLNNGPTAETAAAGIPKALAIEDRPKRYKMITLLTQAGAAREAKEISAAMVQVLQSKPIDAELLNLLLEHGKGDVNFLQGIPVVHAVHNGNSAILELLLQKGKPTPETLNRGLDALTEMPTDAAKAAKFESILQRSNDKAFLSHLLVKEVQTLVKTTNEKQLLTVVKSLLSSGADVNFHKGAGLCIAVSAANAPVSDLLFAARPNPMCLAAGLPHALHIADPMDRLTFTKKLIDAGAPAGEANRALVHAVNTYPDDISLIKILGARAELGDGEALSCAIRRENADVVEVLLRDASKKYVAALFNAKFEEAAKVAHKEKRLRICELLLGAGASEPVVSDALLAAAADGDLALGKMLLDRGASADHKEGQAIVEACRAGAADVLRMLLGSRDEVKKPVLAKGFQAATEAGDLKKRADVFRLLLEKGVGGEVVDAQLVSSARFGDDGTPLVRLLLEFGANVNYNNGDAVWTATRSAMMGNLALMLGIEKAGERQQKPSTATLAKALKASWRLSRDPRYQVIEWVFAAGQPVSQDEIHMTLSKAVKNEPDLRLIRLLLGKGASPLTNGCQSLIDAAQSLLVDVVDVFLEAETPQSDLSWTFKETFTPAAADVWLSEQGYQIAKRLLEKGAQGGAVATALSTAVDIYVSDPNMDALTRRFIDLLVLHADVNSEDGLVLQKAARLADPELVEQILKQKPGSHTISLAFPYIFDSDLDEDRILPLIALFTNYHDGEERLDVVSAHAESGPVLFRAVSQFPRSVKVVQALLEAGFYRDQMEMALVMAEVEEEEPVSLLLWALLQPQKRVSDGVVELLISSGANVNFETRLSKTTPLMLAVQNRRQNIVKCLILAGAEVDVIDATGNTPLTMATRVGGDLGTSMMSNILAAEPSKNDGSLHNAARELNLRAVQVLVDFGHDLDFPSPIHGGRSALAELCLNAAHAGALTAAQEKQMAKVMAYLVEQGTDLSLHSDGKSALLLALESPDALATTRALLKAGMWKHINEPFNNYVDNTYTYSPTQYVTRVLSESPIKPALLGLLKANRARDIFYANDGPQPEGAVNLPEDLLHAERMRRARLERLALESEDQALAAARQRDMAAVQNRLLAERAELEEARARRRHAEELGRVREASAVQDEVFAAQLRRARAEREEALGHERALAEAGLARTRLIAEARMEVEEGGRARMLEWERRVGAEQVRNAKELSAVRVREREEVERLDAANEARVLGRIAEQRRLVDSQNSLAGKLTASGANGRRQIGYITGELD